MKIFLFIILAACSGLSPQAPKEGKKTFSYTDVSGKFIYTRESKLTNGKLVSRAVLTQSEGQVLEKSITVSQLGTIKSNTGRSVTLRPLASEFEVWLEGKKYSSSMRLNPKKKSMVLTLESPDPKWKGVREIPFPKGSYFCFYSQIPDCIYHNQLLHKASRNKNEEYNLYVVWDSFPFIQDQLSNVGQKLFSPATLKYDGKIKGSERFALEVDGQMILYHFSKSFDLVRIFWIAQGISVLPPGEEAIDPE